MLHLLNILVTYYDQAIWSELWKCCPSTGTQGTNGYMFDITIRCGCYV